MLTGLYSAQADSTPILVITGQAPRARLFKEDFQAVDIEKIAAPLTKMAVTVREPALVPRVFQQAFHLMRSGRPGPVLIDLPMDVQLAEIEFDPDTYTPLEVYKPKASRAQIEKAIAMLNESERPLIVSGGGVINADASAQLVEFAEILGVPVIPTLMGWGTFRTIIPCKPGKWAFNAATAMATPLCWLLILCWASAIAGRIVTRARWMFIRKIANSFTWISSRRKLVAFSVRITALCPMQNTH
jgi:tartronate-semialdehyde synthase